MKLQNLTACSLGNIIEWLDFGLFIYLAPIIGAQFFPIGDSQTAAITAFAVFAAGSICRPLGGILFGHLGDRIGRAKTLRWSILCISFSTLLIGLLPTYHYIGAFASLLFVGTRLVQGLSVGGEYSGIAVYLSESAKEGRVGFSTSFAAAGANLGFLFATLSTIILQSYLTNSNRDWIWRLPFLLSGGLGFLILYFRLKLLETPVYQQLKVAKHVERKPLWTALRMHRGLVLIIVGLTCMGSTFYFVFFGFMPTFLAQHHIDTFRQGLSLQAILLTLMLVFIPVAGYAGDRYGRRKLLFCTSCAMLILILPCFYLLQWFTLPVLLIAAILSSLEQGNTLVTASENCPPQVRYSTVAFSYNLGNAIFGGTAPLIASLLAKKIGMMAPGFYLLITCSLGLLAITFLPKQLIYRRTTKAAIITPTTHPK